MNDPAYPTRPSPLERLGDLFSLLGLAAFSLPALAAFGVGRPLALARSALGAFAEPGLLLLVFVGGFFLGALFGTVKRALPVLSGLAAALVLFGGAFDLPYLGFLREALFRFAPFAQSGPGLFAGALAAAAGNLLGRSERLKPLPGILLPPALGAAALLALAATNPFPPTSGLALDAASVDSALESVALTLGRKYRRPGVEEAIRKVVEEKDATLAERERALGELASRLAQAEKDREALLRSASEGGVLRQELEEARNSIAELQAKLEKDLPLVEGGRYQVAVQGTDPAVRDFAVRAASAAPGPWDNPQGSRLPNAAGARQLALIHAAIASNWKYVSDPAVSWTDYTSPARRTLSLGLAGDCDDYAALMASCIQAVGGRVRIIHGSKGSVGHAWAEVWVGRGGPAEAVLAAVARGAGKSPGSLAATLDKATGDRWLVLDWQLGVYSYPADLLEVAYLGDI